MQLVRQLQDSLFGGSPFEGFGASAFPYDLQGWCHGEHVMDQVVDQIRPGLIIEVGTWKGASAFRLLRRALKHGDAGIVCIDTWLGSPEHWLRPAAIPMLKLLHGRPTLYEQFLANVVHAGLQDHVVPLPLPSRLASIVLRQMGVLAPLVYIDGAHDEASVREDIAAYWPLVVGGGVLMGDDYNPVWPGVISAVHAFWEERSSEIAYKIGGDTKWVARKARTPSVVASLPA